jgi:hypothetical protein
MWGGGVALDIAVYLVAIRFVSQRAGARYSGAFIRPPVSSTLPTTLPEYMTLCVRIGKIGLRKQPLNARIDTHSDR